MRSENSTHLPKRFTAVPHELIREHMPNLSGAELKCLLYIATRTWGFNKRTDPISLRQFTEGITRKDGSKLDHGTGLSRSSVKRALASLQKKGLIGREQRWTRYGDQAPTLYCVAFGHEDGVGSGSAQPRSTSDTTQGPIGLLQETGNQEIAAQEKDLKKQDGAASPLDLDNLGSGHRLDYQEKKRVTSRLREVGVDRVSDLVDGYLNCGRGFTLEDITSMIEKVLASRGVIDHAAVIAHRLQEGNPP